MEGLEEMMGGLLLSTNGGPLDGFRDLAQSAGNLLAGEGFRSDLQVARAGVAGYQNVNIKGAHLGNINSAVTMAKTGGNYTEDLNATNQALCSEFGARDYNDLQQMINDGSVSMDDIVKASGMNEAQTQVFFKSLGVGEGMLDGSVIRSNGMYLDRSTGNAVAGMWGNGYAMDKPMADTEYNQSPTYKMSTISWGIMLALPKTIAGGFSFTGALVTGIDNGLWNGEFGLGLYFGGPVKQGQNVLVVDTGLSIGEYQNDSDRSLDQAMNSIPNTLKNNKYIGYYQKSDTGEWIGSAKSLEEIDPQTKSVKLSIGFGNLETEQWTLLNINSSNVNEYLEKQYLKFQMVTTFTKAFFSNLYLTNKK